jgi:beta-lactam-binding protein with PASTA domain
LQTIFDFSIKNWVNMTKTNFSFKTKVGFILFNCIAAAVLLVVIFLLVNWGLHKYTQHGFEIVVPDVTGLTPEEAEEILASEGLKLEILDSTYTKKEIVGTFLEQNPKAGTIVKPSRIIYVIKNSKYPRKVMMPEFRNISHRQVEAKLRTMGMVIGEVKYETSAFKNIVLDVRINGKPLSAGSLVSEGTKIDLLVGKGFDEEEVTVPSVIGLTLSEARAALMEVGLIVGGVTYNEQPTEATWGKHKVYAQYPEEGKQLSGGSIVTVKMSLSGKRPTVKEQAVLEENDFEPEEDEFFE